MFGSLAPRPTGETPSAGEQHVYVLRDGKLQPITVTVGLTDGQRTQITGDGLAVGDLVVTGAKGR